MMMLAASQTKGEESTEAKAIIEAYTKLSEQGTEAEKLGEEAKTLGEQAKTAGEEAQKLGTEAASATDPQVAAQTAAEAQAKSQEAQDLAAQAQEKGTQAQEVAEEAKTAADAMPDKVIAARKATQKAMGDLGEDSMKTVGIQFVLAEYKALKMDTQQIQTNYMIKTGGKMVGLTFLSAAAAVIVGWIASMVAASVGRNLRVAQYERTLQFSNNEMEKFSPASLITRNTNDIQQIQMGIVMIIRMVLYAPILGIGGVYQVAKTGTGMGWIVGVAVGAVLFLVVTLLAFTMPKFKALQNLVPSELGFTGNFDRTFCYPRLFTGKI